MPVSRMPARAPNTRMAAYPAKPRPEISTTISQVVYGLKAPYGPSARSGTSGRITPEIAANCRVARTSCAVSARAHAWIGCFEPNRTIVRAATTTATRVSPPATSTPHSTVRRAPANEVLPGGSAAPGRKARAIRCAGTATSTTARA